VLKAKEKSTPREDLTPGRRDSRELEQPRRYSSIKLASTFKAFDDADAKDKVSLSF
jgi:hypothetical protein